MNHRMLGSIMCFFGPKEDLVPIVGVRSTFFHKELPAENQQDVERHRHAAQYPRSPHSHSAYLLDLDLFGLVIIATYCHTAFSVMAFGDTAFHRHLMALSAEYERLTAI